MPPLADPCRRRRRAPLLEEPLAVDPVGRPDQRHGLAGQVGHQDGGDPGVVVHHPGFREGRTGVQDLVEVGQTELPTLDLDPDLVHCANLVGRRFHLRPAQLLHRRRFFTVPTTIWTGSISFGLVTVPVKLTSGDEVA